MEDSQMKIREAKEESQIKESAKQRACKGWKRRTEKIRAAVIERVSGKSKSTGAERNGN